MQQDVNKLVSVEKCCHSAGPADDDHTVHSQIRRGVHRVSVP